MTVATATPKCHKHRKTGTKRSDPFSALRELGYLAVGVGQGGEIPLAIERFQAGGARRRLRSKMGDIYGKFSTASRGIGVVTGNAEEIAVVAARRGFDYVCQRIGQRVRSASPGGAPPPETPSKPLFASSGIRDGDDHVHVVRAKDGVGPPHLLRREVGVRARRVAHGQAVCGAASAVKAIPHTASTTCGEGARPTSDATGDPLNDTAFASGGRDRPRQPGATKKVAAPGRAGRRSGRRRHGVARGNRDERKTQLVRIHQTARSTRVGAQGRVPPGQITTPLVLSWAIDPT